MAAGYDDDEAAGFASAVRQRRKALMQRLFMGSAAALIFSPLIGWEFCVLWAIAYFAIQMIEMAIFAPINRDQPQPMGTTRTVLGHMVLLANAIAFGGLSIPLWMVGGAMGGVCATILLCAGAIYSTINSPGSVRVLVSTLSAQAVYLGMTPWFMAELGAPPAYVSASLVAVLTFFAYCLSTWKRMSRAREAEVAARLIAERRQGEAERAMASRAAFLAAVGHDLRTPISAIMTGASELERGAESGAARQQAALILEAGHMMKDMLDDLLDHAKLDAGRMTVEAEPFDLRLLIAHTHRFWKGAATAKGLRLRVEGAACVPQWVEGDPGRLRQILNNLISNALKFTDEGAICLAFRAWEEEPSAHALVIEVRDTGPGMKPEQLSRLFTAFDQTADGVSARHGGTGLGLSISRDLALLMGGRLTARSLPGEGATFTLALHLPRASAVETPIAPAHLQPSARAPISRAFEPRLRPVESLRPEPEALVAAVSETEAETAEAGRALRVLIVDDHEINRRAIQLILLPLGVDVSQAADGMAALKATETEAFDVIFMDVRMPELDGRETTRRLRAAPGPNQHTSVIAVTADTAEEDVAACMAAGMDYFVSKPLTPQALLGALQTVLEGAEDSRETVAA